MPYWELNAEVAGDGVQVLLDKAGQEDVSQLLCVVRRPACVDLRAF